MSAFSDDFVTIYHGDAWELAPTLAPQSIHAIVTSPPYWGLRDYGEPGQFGLESTPDEYVTKLVALFALLRPALRDDGTVWLNLGDSYASFRDSKCSPQTLDGEQRTMPKQGAANRGSRAFSGSAIKHKDLCGIPWRIAFALQADGWYLRQDIIWHKPNPMPESVADRCTKAHEYLFLLSKSPRYYYDHEAIKEDASCAGRVLDYTGDQKNNDTDSVMQATRPKGRVIEVGATRNKRSVWTVPTRSFAAAHFAVFPSDLIKPCILAGVPERCCSKCGAPWVREVEKQSHKHHTTTADGKSKDGPYANQTGDGADTHDIRHGCLTTTTVGFSPSCSCGMDATPGTVLDPFMGSGTTAQVARSLGRRAVGFEISADYIEIAAKHRLAQAVLL